MSLKEEYSEEWAEEWVVETWRGREWIRDYQSWFKWDEKSLLYGEVICEFRPMALQEAMEVAKYRSANHRLYRLRNLRTGDILPEAILR